MALEVARGEGQGFPADVWAMGCESVAGDERSRGGDVQSRVLRRRAGDSEVVFQRGEGFCGEVLGAGSGGAARAPVP